MSREPSISISHAGFHVFDMDVIVDCFQNVYGFEVTDRAALGERGEIAVLGTDPRNRIYAQKLPVGRAVRRMAD